MIPFTHQALWKKVEDDEVISASKSTSAGSLPSSTPWPTVIATIGSNTTLPTPGGLLTTHPLDLSAPSPALRIKFTPDAVLKAIDYMRSCALAASGILEMERLVMQNLRLHEAAKIIGEWMRMIPNEEDNETNIAKRISSRNVFDKAVSATKDKSLTMLKAKSDAKEEDVIALAAKKDQAKDKRAKYTTALVTTGSEIMKRLEQLGPSELLRLKIDELYDLLVSNDPRGAIPKPNKKIGQEEANLLPRVQAALRRFHAVATTSAAQAPPLLPIPFAPVTCEGEKYSKFAS